MNKRIKRTKVYYDMDTLQTKLYEESKKGKKSFKGLLELILSEENILLAYRTIKGNKGANTPASDGRGIADIAGKDISSFLSEIREKVLNYTPSSVRRTYIPKPNGDRRPLGIPNVDDKIVQQMFLQILSPICEGKFFNHSYGFRPTRNQHHALGRMQYLINRSQLHYVVDVDIKGFFDNISHNLLIKQLWNIGIKDKRVLLVISKMLKAPLEGIGIPDKGVPQGGVLSPLLSNVVLHDLDEWVANQWENFPTKKEHTQNSHRYRTQKTTRLKEGYLVRYADDFKILTRTYKDAVRWFHAVKEFLKRRLKLDISTEKSKIIDLKRKFSNFLGFRVKAIRKAGKYVAYSRIAEKSLEGIKKNYLQLIKNVQKKPKTSNVLRLNSFILGVHNYFKVATHCSLDFRMIESKTKYALKRKLKKVAKYEYPNPKIAGEIYCRNYSLTRKAYKVMGSYIYPIGNRKTETIYNYKQDTNPFIRKVKYDFDKEILKLMRSRLPSVSVEYMDNRLSKYSMQKGKCAILGIQISADEVHCHHILPKYVGGNDHFDNLTILHKDMHKLIHLTNPKRIESIIRTYNLTSRQIKKVNQLRDKCGLGEISI